MDTTFDGQPYHFYEGQNRYLNNSNSYQIGLSLMKKGDLYEAILAFEAAVQQNPKNSHAWKLLGSCHAECDDDMKAISALTTAVKADPTNLEALLELGVSYTNELNKFRALSYLASWIKNHPLYSSLYKEPNYHNLDYEKYHDEILQMFIKASKMGKDDPDIFTVLGIFETKIFIY